MIPIRKHYGSLAFLILLALFGISLTKWITTSRERPFSKRKDNTLCLKVKEPESLNTLLCTSSDSGHILDCIHHELLERDYATNQFKPVLVESWENTNNGHDYIFHLRTDVRWHDGEIFDADDVMYSFQMCTDPLIPGFARDEFIISALRETAPMGDGDEKVEAEEFARLDLADLPTLANEPLMDGQVEAAALVVESTRGWIRAARYGDQLYFACSVLAGLDSVLFVAREPGQERVYCADVRVAEWDAQFMADNGNRLPTVSGWIPSEEGKALDNTDFAIGDGFAECILDLKELYPDSMPEQVYVALALVDDVKLSKIDDYTVHWHFPKRIYTNLEAAGSLRLVAEHYYNDLDIEYQEHPRRDIPLGVGPYRFVEWDTNNRIVVERWDDYWGEKKPKIRRIEFRIINDGVVAYQVLNKGDIDALLVGTNVFKNKTDSEFFKQHFFKMSFYLPGYSYMSWNNKRSFFNDKRCRQAMSHLLDVESAAHNIYLDMACPVTGPFYFKEPAYDSELKPYEYNIEKAKQLLDEAGWVDSDGDGIRDKDLNGDQIISKEPLDDDLNRREVFDFEILLSGGIDTQNNWRALMLIRNCEKVGIKCKIRMVEWALFLPWLVQRRFDAATATYGLSIEADPYMHFHSSQAREGYNRQQYVDAEMDRLLEEARQELDKQKRTALFRKIHAKLREDQPLTFQLARRHNWLINKRIKNVTAYDSGFNFLEWEIEGHEDGN
jgi:ABC-type transport system substrate-binding protein